MTVEYKNGEIVSLDGHGNGIVWNPGKVVTSVKLNGTTVIVNTREGYHYEYDGLTGVFDHERSTPFNNKRRR